MRTCSAFLRRAAVTFAALSAVAGCTLLGNFASERCTTDSHGAPSPECESRGLRGYVCSASNCESGSGRSDGGADTGQANAAAPECTTNDECTRRAGEVPTVCAKGRCVAAKIAGVCPIILGEEYFRKPETIVLGAFVESLPESALGSYNIDLALGEINLAGGIPSAAGARRFSVLVCSKATPALVQQASTHLIDELELPAVYGQLETDELKDVAPKAAKTDTFLLSTLGNDRSLRGSLGEDSALWFAAGDIFDVAPAFAPLVTAVESYVKTSRSKSTIKLALVSSQSFETRTLAAALDDLANPVLRFNGKTPREQIGTNYRRTDDVPSKYRTGAQPDYSAVIGQLTDFQPDVIVGVAGDELVQDIIPGVEAGWGANPDRPYYVAAPLSRFNVQLYEQTQPEPPRTLRKRFVGVDFSGSAADLAAYDQRLAAHRNNFLASSAREGFNLLYDATYLVALAAMAAGPDGPPSGRKIAASMARITDRNGSVVHAGTSKKPGLEDDSFIGALAVLARGAPVRFSGTTGLFDVDPATHNRTMGATAYCIDAKDAPRFRFYGTSYDAQTQSLTGLVGGKPPCW